uniref:Uncharacterized protein n=1 Tax=Oryza glumipatula TaxID=40148 RepID=A0A0D9ZW79_9ORYZ
MSFTKVQRIRQCTELIVEPEKFTPQSCLKLQTINKEEKLAKQDLINYFDPKCNDSKWFQYSQNLLINFSKVALDAKIAIKDITKFQNHSTTVPTTVQCV